MAKSMTRNLQASSGREPRNLTGLGGGEKLSTHTGRGSGGAGKTRAAGAASRDGGAGERRGEGRTGEAGGVGRCGVGWGGVEWVRVVRVVRVVRRSVNTSANVNASVSASVVEMEKDRNGSTRVR